mgnify:CR=1 FL=1
MSGSQGSSHDGFEGLRRLDLRSGDPMMRAAWRALCERSVGLDGEADAAARTIVEQVRREGDAALIALTERFEGRRLSAAELELPLARAHAAHEHVAVRRLRGLLGGHRYLLVLLFFVLIICAWAQRFFSMTRKTRPPWGR